MLEQVHPHFEPRTGGERREGSAPASPTFSPTIRSPDVPAKRVRFAYIPDDPRAEVRYVYFIEAVGVGLIKIGLANCVRKRLASLTPASPVPLRLMCKTPTDRVGTLEKELHVRFAEHRAHGEWFRVAPDLTAYIDALLADGAAR